MSAVLEIVQVGQPVLRRVARAVASEELRSAELRLLIDRMRDTMRAAPGVGLAAPQVGQGLQLVVIEDPPSLQTKLTAEQLVERERVPVAFHVLVNPTLTVVGAETVEAFEGCLSLPGLVMGVTRARRVRVEGLDELGQPRVIAASGWYARILQHEVDHLRGVLCCDRMDPRTLTSLAQYERLWRDGSPADMRARLAEPG